MDVWLDVWSQAACRGEDPEIFFPEVERGPGARELARAKAVCGGCPVALPCLEWALSTGQRTGVWGGTSESERRTLHRRLERRGVSLDISDRIGTRAERTDLHSAAGGKAPESEQSAAHNRTAVSTGPKRSVISSTRASEALSPLT
ncbi:WhiB family transcriptional regulator [Streptacidiphilus sp. MAP12-16]|uniref:WhiB family transcriptional regulator n=1 Tax=Streptacidiphilus sp. MAP12-16 TaxID=3156300 RepID=UPI003518EE2E